MELSNFILGFKVVALLELPLSSVVYNVGCLAAQGRTRVVYLKSYIRLFGRHCRCCCWQRVGVEWENEGVHPGRVHIDGAQRGAVAAADATELGFAVALATLKLHRM